MRFFEKHHVTAALTLACLALARPVPLAAEGLSGAPSVSADGGKVAFISSALAVQEFRNLQVHVRDRETGTVLLVSRSADGTPGNNDSVNPSISADGRHVIYQSFADNLVEGDTNKAPDVFVHDLTDGSTIMLELERDSWMEPNSHSKDYLLSRAGGAALIYMSPSFTYHDEPDPPRSLHRYDLTSRTLEQVFVEQDQESLNGSFHAISDDGNTIIYTTYDRDYSFHLWSAVAQTSDPLNVLPTGDPVLSLYGVSLCGDGQAVFVLGRGVLEEGGSSLRFVLRRDLASGAIDVLRTETSSNVLEELELVSNGDGSSAFMLDHPRTSAGMWYWNEDLEMGQRIVENLIPLDAQFAADESSLILSARSLEDLGNPDAPRPTLLYRYDPIADVLTELPLGGEDERFYQTDGLVMTDDGTLFFHTDKNGVASSDDNGAFDVYALSPDTSVADWISALIVQAQPVLNLIIGDSGGAILTWTAEVGRSYLVEFKNAVNDPEWTVLMAAAEADTSNMTATDNEPGDQRYYRVVERSE